MSDWVNCSERMPDETDDYLTYSEIDGVPINEVHTFFANRGYFSCETREDRFITHWMPLPEPPTK